MPKTIFAISIQSRPVYGELWPRPGTSHLMIADAEGAGAILNLMARGGDALLAMSHIIHVQGRSGTEYAVRLAALKPAQFQAAPTYGAALPRLKKVLADAHMGLQVYLAGTEGLMGQTQTEAVAAGIPAAAIQMEHCGSRARRVQCVHCKGITETVCTDPFRCAHCGLDLFVRDHYSRRIAAFQGVNIDAETPGVVPAALERFP